MSKRKNKNRRSPKFAKSNLETLESRVLLAGDTTAAWHNADMANDVNQDGYVSPIDAFRIVMDIRENGARELPELASGEPGSVANIAMVDTNADGFITARDVLQVVQEINAGSGEGEFYRIRPEITNTAGEVVTNVDVGETFNLSVFVQDQRGADAAGIFTAYTDVTYDASLVSVPAGSSVTHGPDFSDAVSSDLAVPGLLDEVGGLNQSTPGLGNEQLLFEITLTADAAGTLTFGTNPADDLPIHEFLAFDTTISEFVPDTDIEFSSVELTIGDVEEAPQDLVAFAEALAADGVQYFSTRQANIEAVEQRNLFEDGASFLPIVESLDAAGNLTAEATAANVTAVNTWVFSDGSQATGVLSLEELSTLSGVAIPTGNTPTLQQIVPDDVVTVELNSPLHLPLDGYIPSNSELTYTVTVEDPSLIEPTVISGNRSWNLELEGYGNLVFELYEGRVPRPTEVFIDFTEAGRYDGTIFHRIIDDFVIQGGDFARTGGVTPGEFDDQFHVDLQHNQAGVLSLAKRTPDDTNTSQFFVTDVETSFLDFNHSVFGQLVEGFDLLEVVSAVSTDLADQPLDDVTVTRATVFEDTENAVLMLRALGSSGTTNVTVTVSDGQGNETSNTFEVNLDDRSQTANPFLNDIVEPLATPGETVEFQLEHQDADGGDVDFFASGSGATVSDTGLVTVVVPPEAVVGDTFDVTVSVAQAGSSILDSQLVTVRVAEAFVAEDDSFSVDEDTGPHSFDVLINDAIGSGDLTITAVGTPSDGNSVTISDDGQSVIYTPVANFPIDSFGAVTETFTYTITDNVTSETSTATVSVTVAPTNDPPTANDDFYPADLVFPRDDAVLRRLREDEGLQVSLNVIANDEVSPDSEIAQVSAVESATSSVAVGALGAFIDYTPGANVFGVDTFVYTFTDPGGLSDTATATILIAQVNDAPTATDDDVTLLAGRTQIITAAQLLGNDSVGPGEEAIQTLSIASVTQPANGSVTLNADGTITYVAAAGVLGPDSFGYTITDDGLTEDFDETSESFVASADPLTATGTVNVTFEEVNVAVDDSFVFEVIPGATDPVTETFDVLVNDLLSFSPVITAVSAATNGTTAIANNGNDIAYSPTVGFTGTDSFTYTVTDSDGIESTATVTVSVQNENALPVAVADAFTVTANGGSQSLDVLDNDTTDAGETATIILLLIEPANGTATISADGLEILYTPDDDFVGTDSLIYQIDDGNGGIDSAEVTITVATSNLDPIAVDDALTFVGLEQQTLDVLANDQGDAGETLTIVGITQAPTNGIATIAPDGLTILYTPIDETVTGDTLTYRISDGNGGFASADVVITAAVNQDPTAADDTFTFSSFDQQTLNVLANDAAGVGEVLSIDAITVAPTNGTATVSADGLTILYTPNDETVTQDSLTYQVSDGNGGFDTANVAITITTTNQDPTAVDDTFTFASFDQQTLDVLANDVGEAGEVLSIDSITVAPLNGTATVSTDGLTILYTPDDGFVGLDSLTYQISDGNGGTANANVSIAVEDPNIDPVANDDTFEITEFGQTTLDVLANDVGEAGETLTITSTTGGNGTVSISGDRLSLLYTPSPNSTGTDSFTYTIDDGAGNTSQATVSLTVPVVESSFFSGVIFQDRDNDGIRDSFEPGIGGVTVVIEGTDADGNDVRRETVSSIDGDYEFDGIAPGDYTITEIQPQFNLGGTNRFGLTVTEDDNLELQVGDELIASDDNSFAERGLFAQFATLESLSSSREDGAFVVLDGDELAWVEDRGGWSGVESLFFGRNGDSLLIQSDSGNAVLSMVDRGTVELIGSSGTFTFLRINGSSDSILTSSAVDAAFAS